MKNNLKTKVLFIILIATLVIAGSTFCTAVKATDEKPEETTKTVDIALNRKVNFTGKTYWFHNAKKVRKEYADGKIGCGVISIIVKNKAANIYVSGEGWIAENQIKGSEKFITLNFGKLDDLKNGNLKAGMKINGEYVDVDIDNEAVVSYADGELQINGQGTANLVLKKSDGTEVNIIASNTEAGFTLSVPEAKVAGEITSKTTIVDKVDVDVTGNGSLALTLEDGKVGVTAEGEGQVAVTADENEILNVSGSVNGKVEGGLDGISASGNASQTLLLLQKITIKLNERASAKVDTKAVEVTAGADATVNDSELAKADGKVAYTYGEEDPTGSIEGQVVGTKFNKSGKIPVVSAFKALLAKISK